VAYLNFLLAASESDVLALSRDPSVVLAPSLVVSVSHLIGYWVQVQPLGKLLGQAIDGGIPMNSDLWHPLRSPVYHQPTSVQELHRSLAEEWEGVLAGTPVPADDWYRIEIEKVVRLFGHASDRAECVVSVLEQPRDHERASKIRIPFKWRE